MMARNFSTRTPATRSLAAALRAKLCSRRGESITEVLVAIVVSGLAILMLATVIATAASTNSSSRTVMEDYYAANNQLVEASESNGAAAITLTEQGGSSPVRLGDGTSVSVNLFVDEQADGTVVASYVPADENGEG